MRELDIAGAASIGGWLRWKKKHTFEPGTPCPNCETPIQGPYCHECGQLAETFERSVGHLFVEGLESFFHFDGRLFQTLPRLALRPHQLTRSYLDGKRASQIPPLRLFLVVLLAVFFIGGLNLSGNTPSAIVNTRTTTNGKVVNKMSKVELNADERKALMENLGDSAAMAAIVNKARARQGLPPAAAEAGAKADRENTNLYIMGKKATPGQTNWFKTRVKRAFQNPHFFIMAIEEWGHRLAFLMLPIAALQLSLFYVFQRRYYVFDHLIFSMHSLAFQGLLISLILLLSAITPLAWWLILLAPVHLFVHMRGTYGSSTIGTLVRMVLLFWGSFLAFSALLTWVLWIGLQAMGDH